MFLQIPTSDRSAPAVLSRDGLAPPAGVIDPRDAAADLDQIGSPTHSPGPRRPSEAMQSRGLVAVGELDFELRERTSVYDGNPGRYISVRVLHLSPGWLDANGIAEHDDDWLGLLILDGLILVELQEGRGHIGWLVAKNDLLRPWDMPQVTLTRSATWRVLTPTRVALLDGEFSRRAAALPAVTRALLSRAARTAHWLLAKSLIVSCPLLEDRLVLLFALLGERWGKVTSEGILLDLPLTHGLLASLCGARRPSITLGLRALQEADVLRRTARRGWLLGRINAAHLDLDHSCWQSYADVLGLV